MGTYGVGHKWGWAQMGLGTSVGPPKCLQRVYLKSFSHAILRDIHKISFVKYSYYVQECLLNVHKDLRYFFAIKSTYSDIF